MKRVRKSFLLVLFLVLMPFLVSARNLEDLELKWSVKDEIFNHETTYLTEHNIIFVNGNKLFYYDREGNFQETIRLNSSYYDMYQKENNFYLTFEKQMLLFDEYLDEKRSFKVDGYISNKFFFDDYIIILDYNDDANLINIYKVDYNFDLISKDYMPSFSSGSSYEENGKIVYKDSYGNGFYIDKDFKIVPYNKCDDGGFLLFYSYDKVIYKYDSNKKCIKTFKLDEYDNSFYGFSEYVVDGYIYLAAYTRVKNEFNTSADFYYHTLFVFKIDQDLNIVNKNTISNNTRSYTGYFEYRFYNNNQKLYIYDGYLHYKYYEISYDDLTFTEVDSATAIPKTDNNYSFCSYSLDYQIYCYLNDNNYSYSDYSYYEDDGDVVVGVNLENDDYTKIKTVIFRFDSDFNLISTFDVNDWQVIDKSLLPDVSNVPCFYKNYDIVIKKYLEDYIVVVFNGANDSYLRIYDKNGKLIKDFSDDIDGIHFAPVSVNVKGNAIFVSVREKFDFACPENLDLNESMDSGEKNNVNFDLKNQLLYYDFPYEIATLTDGNGEVKVSKNSEFSGKEITFEVVPVEGYVLKAVKVTDSNGNVVVFTDYTFTMPSSDVIIEASFVPENPNTADILIIGLIVLFGIGIVWFSRSKKKVRWLSS